MMTNDGNGVMTINEDGSILEEVIGPVDPQAERVDRGDLF